MSWLAPAYVAKLGYCQRIYPSTEFIRRKLLFLFPNPSMYCHIIDFAYKRKIRILKAEFYQNMYLALA